MLSHLSEYTDLISCVGLRYSVLKLDWFKEAHHDPETNVDLNEKCITHELPTSFK